ncbi:MAG TPA: type II CRISPR RNA-guided endonuclease Cas9, partial [Phnomibacter sp.]|nr:type II CRISPR RNA-guided endonuclease Cas9 [Phnomibacter sp.]
KQGKIYNEAVVLAGLQKAFGAARWQQMSATEKQAIEDTVEGLLHTDGKGTIKQKVRQYLADAYKLTEQQLNKLYHHSDVSNIVTTGQFPTEDAEIEKIKNPVVMAALFEVRKLVTALIKEYGHPDEIRVEMARELKAGKAKRDEIRLKQYENEKANNEAKKILDEYNKPHTRTNVRKILLYKEIEKVAGSAVNPFNPAQTFNIERLFEDGYVQIEHIVPYSISLDDSMGNLTLCDADTNRAKGNKTPAQFFGADPAAWEAHKKQIFKILPYQKAKRFVDDRAHQLEGFIQRQLNDTRYIAKFAKEFLKHVCPRVTISQGAATSQLRHVWGLNSLLSNNYVISPALEGECVVAINQKNELVPSSARLWQWSEGDKINKASEAELRKMGRVLWGYASQGTFYPYKSRDDHRHHAVDALVIACTKTSYLQQLSTYNARVGYEAAAAQAAQFPVPWPTYYNDCRQAINAILVSNKKQNKVLTKVRKALFDKASGKPLIIDGKRRYGAGIAARGALHKATLFGRYINQNDANPYYHIRKRLDKLSGEQL